MHCENCGIKLTKLNEGCIDNQICLICEVEILQARLRVEHSVLKLLLLMNFIWIALILFNL